LYNNKYFLYIKSIMKNINEILDEILKEKQLLINKYCLASNNINISDITKHIIPKITKLNMDPKMIHIITKLLIMKINNYCKTHKYFFN